MLNILSIFLGAWGFLWFVLLLVFLLKELYRRFITDRKIKKDTTISQEERDQKLGGSKKSNINTLFGLDKKTFIMLAANMIILSLAFLSFNETTNTNNKIVQILQEILNKSEK